MNVRNTWFVFKNWSYSLFIPGEELSLYILKAIGRPFIVFIFVCITFIVGSSDVSLNLENLAFEVFHFDVLCY